MSPLKRTLIDPEQPYERRLGPCVLYLDDIEVIHDALKDASHEIHAKGDPTDLEFSLGKLTPEERQEFLRLFDVMNDDSSRRPNGGSEHRCVAIRAGSANADEVADLRDAEPSEIRDLQLRLAHHRLTIVLGPRSARVWTSSQNADARALADAIADYVARKQSFGATVVLGLHESWKFWLGLSLLSTFSSMLPLAQQFAPPTFIPISIALGLLVGSALWVASLLVFGRRFGGVAVIPRRRAESRGLSARQWGSIGLAVVSAIVGSLITAWLT